MAQYPKPSSTSGTFNNTSFNNNQTGGLTIAEGLKYFISYPKTQSPSTITADNFTTTGNLDVAGDSQFGGDVNFLGGVSITGGITFENDVEVVGTTTLDDNLLCLTTATVTELLTCQGGVDITTIGDGITFPDNTTQTTAFIEANYAQLNTDNTFLAPYIQTFQQNNSTTSSTAPLQINNITNSDNIAFYIDPSVGNDLTLYSSQSTGGLTVRNPTASFTLNPVVLSPGIVGAQSLNPIDMNGYNLLGLTNVYADSSGMTFIDSSNSSMLQLTNGGHTSYENINMNNNTIYGASSVTSPLFLVGSNGQIGNSATLNPQIMTIRNTALNNTSPQIYFQINDNTNNATSPMQILWDNVNFIAPVGGISSQVLNVSGSGITVGAVPLKINNISGNGQGFVGFNADINMNSNNIINCGSGSTGITQALGTNNTTLATTAFVIANQPSTSNFAQLTTATTQTFTGPINFSSATKYNNNQVATINQLPFNTSTTISNYTLLSPTNITLNSGFSQISTYYPSTGQALFINYPINITVTAYVAVNAPLCYIQFSTAPFPSYPPVTSTGQIATTLSTGGVNLAGYVWTQIGTTPILQINMPYNVGTGSNLTFTLASLGMITV